MKFHGSCHCKAVQFEITASEPIEVDQCNCSICTKSGFLHCIIPLKNFTLIQGADCLTTYRFNTGVAKHTFCKFCGIKPFYTPRSNPDGIDINMQCLEPQPTISKITPFDGQNWEQNVHKLVHKSKTTDKQL